MTQKTSSSRRGIALVLFATVLVAGSVVASLVGDYFFAAPGPSAQISQQFAGNSTLPSLAPTNNSAALVQTANAASASPSQSYSCVQVGAGGGGFDEEGSSPQYSCQALPTPQDNSDS